MKRIAVKFAIALLTLLIGVSLYRSLSSGPSHLWGKLGGAQAVYNGQAASAKVYRSADGQILIDLSESGDGLYLLIPGKSCIGVPNRSNFIELPGFVYSKEVSPPSAPPGKMEIEPKLMIQAGLIEFTSLEGARVRMSW